MKLNKQELEAIVKVFAKEPNGSEGICINYIYPTNFPQFNLDDRIEIEKYLKQLLIQCCKELGIYSGKPEIPIKHRVGASVAYRTYLLWNKKTQYGRNRWAVLNLMRKKLREELENTL